MGIASRTKWQRRKTNERRIREGKETKPYKETIRKQDKLAATKIEVESTETILVNED